MRKGEAAKITGLLERYGTLLDEVDRWFNSCLDKYPQMIDCRKGCSYCCRGLFDITLLDAFYLKEGIDLLPEETRKSVIRKSAERIREINTKKPAFVHPWILNDIAEDEWEEIMPEDDEAPCILLSDAGMCLAYRHRPMTCRLNGIPLIDVTGEEMFDDWCTMNFIGADPVKMNGLRHDFNSLFRQELLLFREFSFQLLGRRVNELDTIIPAAVFYDVQESDSLAYSLLRSVCN